MKEQKKGNLAMISLPSNGIAQLGIMKRDGVISCPQSSRNAGGAGLQHTSKRSENWKVSLSELAKYTK